MKSGISVTGKATTHDCAEDVGVTCYRNVSAWRIKGCENIPGEIDFNCLRSTGSGGADPAKTPCDRLDSGSDHQLELAGSPPGRRGCQGWRLGYFGQHSDYRGRLLHLHVSGEPDFRRYASFNGDLSGNVAVDNELCIGVRKGGAAGVAILYRFAAANS